MRWFILRLGGEDLLSSAYSIVLSVAVPISCDPSFMTCKHVPLCKFLMAKGTDVPGSGLTPVMSI